MTPDEFKEICAEYDKAPDDADWGEDHPIFQLANENDILKKKYNELIMAVVNKIPNETRHESALRIITQAETSSNNCASEAL